MKLYMIVTDGQPLATVYLDKAKADRKAALLRKKSGSNIEVRECTHTTKQQMRLI